MDNLARKISENRGELLGTVGVVRSKDGASFEVETADRAITARRASGCLLEPMVGDTVLVGVPSGGHPAGAWLLTVLERDNATSAEISVEGDLRLRTAHGKVAIVAQEGIDLISSAVTRIVTNGVEVRSPSASLVVDGLEVVGSWVRAEFDQAKVVAKSLDQFLDRFSQRVRRSYRRVEDIDQLHAGSVHHRVEKTLRVHAHDTAITADGLVKIDGEQIHVG